MGWDGGGGGRVRVWSVVVGVHLPIGRRSARRSQLTRPSSEGWRRPSAGHRRRRCHRPPRRSRACAWGGRVWRTGSRGSRSAAADTSRTPNPSGRLSRGVEGGGGGEDEVTIPPPHGDRHPPTHGSSRHSPLPKVGAAALRKEARRGMSCPPLTSRAMSKKPVSASSCCARSCTSSSVDTRCARRARRSVLLRDSESSSLSSSLSDSEVAPLVCDPPSRSFSSARRGGVTPTRTDPDRPAATSSDPLPPHHHLSPATRAVAHHLPSSLAVKTAMASVAKSATRTSTISGTTAPLAGAG